MSAQAPLILAGNWKMNGTAASLAEIDAMGAGFTQIANIDAITRIMCVPTTLLDRVSQKGAAIGIKSGGQNCHRNASGAHTGDISAAMLKDAGADYVIVGHSERRADHGETDGIVRAKAEIAFDADLVPIVCVGETLAERRNGLAETVVEQQLSGSVPAADKGANIVIAYEPVWAIGTGEVPSEKDIADMHLSIRNWLVKHYGEAGHGIAILYGGSLKPSNATEILAIDNVNGGLIGGASLKATDYLGICEAAAAQI